MQVNQAAEAIYDLVDEDCNLIFGAVVDPSLNQEVRDCWPKSRLATARCMSREAFCLKQAGAWC